MRNRITPNDFLEAARVPPSLQPQRFGDWRIDRLSLPECRRRGMPWKDYTLLRCLIYPPLDMSNIHLADDNGTVSKLDVVMEDSPKELRRHLPIWLEAYGNVLVTGLWLGCVVRGLLAIPHIDHIDVVEIDSEIIRVVGAGFAANSRVSFIYGDALTAEFAAERQWDFAWHDIWTENNTGLDCAHVRLIMRFDSRVQRQGAWAFPREMKRLSARKGLSLIGGKRAA
jgi:hypothetical protein